MDQLHFTCLHNTNRWGGVAKTGALGQTMAICHPCISPYSPGINSQSPTPSFQSSSELTPLCFVNTETALDVYHDHLMPKCTAQFKRNNAWPVVIAPGLSRREQALLHHKNNKILKDCGRYINQNEHCSITKQPFETLQRRPQ